MIRKQLLLLLPLSGLLFGCSKDKNPMSYLEIVLNELEQINSATYYTKGEAYAPGDTLAYTSIYRYVKEYSNPADTFVGATFLNFRQEDTTMLESYWDGYMQAVVYHDKKGILIDSFKNDPRPFRVVNAPFFTKTKKLIEYALETEDSISISSEEFGDSFRFDFCIYDTIIEFIGITTVYPASLYGSHKGKISKYTLWISKSDNLPYRFERDMPHDKTTLACSKVKFNTGALKDLKATDYFPLDYEIREFIRGRGISRTNPLEGRRAPDWILQDADNNKFALGNMKSKVILIQFTSVSCGPCNASVPFLNQLVEEYDKDQFDFVAIEAYDHTSSAMKSYRRSNNMEYRFLMSSQEVTKSYHIEAVPTFFILDENRVIRKVIRGYNIGSTDTMIRASINNLIQRVSAHNTVYTSLPPPFNRDNFLNNSSRLCNFSPEEVATSPTLNRPLQ